ncbi:MAG TPA: hypothetical protein VJ656_02720 [Pyrinomonadaceae bacterium]|nr:hypothetical protein [Pyrinomonadaceae bacterium]
MIHFLVPATQDRGIKDYLDVFGAPLRHEFRILYYEDLANQKEFPRGTYVLTALDQLSSATADLLAEIYQQLKDAPGIRFLNNPTKTLQRFDLLTELNRRGMNEFRVARAGSGPNNIRFPVFVRNERLHEGALSPLLNSEREIRQAIGRALVQGHKLRDLLLVEFCDTANENGYYHKYAAFVVGKKVIPRSLNYGREWMLKHSQTEFTLPMVHKELEYVSQNPHEQQLSKIFELAQVEYGRIDYAIKDGRVQTWEINLNPTIGRGLRPPSKKLAPEVDAARDGVRQCFFSGFAKGWKEVMLPTHDQPPVVVEVRPSIINAAKAHDRADHARQNRLLNWFRTVLRPLKPLIEPLSSPFLRALGWFARLFHR